jgi:hypothetical protein
LWARAWPIMDRARSGSGASVAANVLTIWYQSAVKW